MSTAGVFAAVNSAIKLADFILDLREVPEELRVFSSLITRVNSDLNEAFRLRRNPAIDARLIATSSQKQWVDSSINDVQKALHDIGVYVENGRLDEEHGKSVGMKTRFEWVVKTHNKIKTRELALATCQRSLLVAIQMMQTLEMTSLMNPMTSMTPMTCSATELPKPPPSYEASVGRAWRDEEDEKPLRPRPRRKPASDTTKDEILREVHEVESNTLIPVQSAPAHLQSTNTPWWYAPSDVGQTDLVFSPPLPPQGTRVSQRQMSADSVLLTPAISWSMSPQPTGTTEWRAPSPSPSFTASISSPSELDLDWKPSAAVELPADDVKVSTRRPVPPAFRTFNRYSAERNRSVASFSSTSETVVDFDEKYPVESDEKYLVVSSTEGSLHRSATSERQRRARRRLAAYDD
ncbi:hypothetical protein W97_02171 [Coniosporium apollinis CBS 100218]|uniref:Fungal N-terminal domain-containing protein n=1 Tax=Coniosporium apollinis (strain CBS 100218) TaxID=1168221 RepID=R7YM06_CONA1|nr:uncharacterized protein W97_02171 [Coniosporium apollinis CBS 100218]EON62945.1 hypothetical protein W97_02171 [Coniosporium apollinis CBS 100218]